MGDCQDLLIDEDTWEAINDPAAADFVARRLFVLKESIDGGAEGVKKASEAILVNIEAAYLQTEAHRAAVRLYLLYLTGQLKPEEEPLRLIGGAIERGEARVKVEGKGSGRGKRKGRRLSE